MTPSSFVGFECISQLAPGVDVEGTPPPPPPPRPGRRALPAARVGRARAAGRGAGRVRPSSRGPRRSEYGFVERCGEFDRVVAAGASVVCWPFEVVAGRVSLRIQQLDVACETKTSDNVFVNVVISVQYKATAGAAARRRAAARPRDRPQVPPDPDQARKAFYELTDPTQQIRSYVYDVVRSTVPLMTRAARARPGPRAAARRAARAPQARPGLRVQGRRRELDQAGARRGHVRVRLCVEIDHWFGTSRPNFEIPELGRIEVDSADFWTDRLLSSSSRSTADVLVSNHSHTLTLKSS